MDRTATALVRFAAGPENIERRAAAMLMLAELGIEDAKAVAAAADGVASPTVLQEYALRYFEKLKPAAGLAHLVPLLDTPDPGIRERARHLVVEHGAAAVPAIVATAATASKPWLASAVEVLAAIGTAAAIRALFELIAGGDAELGRAGGDALHRRIRGLAEPGRRQLLEHALAAATRSAVSRSTIAKLTLVRVLAELALPQARQWLLGEATADEDPALRAEALRALAASLRQEKLTAKEVAALCAMLGDQDFARVVRPALDALEHHRFGSEAQSFLLGLRQSPHVAVRSFALAKLGESEAPKAVSALLSSLEDAEAVRRSAAGSLRKIPEARQALMKHFIAATDPSTAFTMAETLAGYGLPWRTPTLEQIWKRYLKAIDEDDRIQGAYLHFLRATAPQFLADGLRTRSSTLLRAGRARDAARLCGIVRELPVAEPEDGYRLALALLKSRPRGLEAPIRRPDAALDLLVELEAGGFATAQRLRRERLLGPEELYAVGFALAETHGPGERVAEDLLGHLAKRYPRTKVGKAARNKLALPR